MACKRIPCILFLCLLCVISGCGAPAMTEPATPVEPSDGLSGRFPVREPEPVVYEETIVPISAYAGIEVSNVRVLSGKLHIDVVNHANSIFDLSYEWFLEKQEDGNWYRLKMPEQLAALDSMIHFEPGARRTITLFLKHYDADSLEDGAYRLVLGGGWGRINEMVEIPFAITSTGE